MMHDGSLSASDQCMRKPLCKFTHLLCSLHLRKVSFDVSLKKRFLLGDLRSQVLINIGAHYCIPSQSLAVTLLHS